jgi:hypothetical protein
MKFRSDIDIDFGDRSRLLSLIKHTPAARIDGDDIKKHNTGVYVTDIPRDPLTGYSAIDYREAEDRGYIKLDLLNVSIYQMVRNERHLDELMARTPPWQRLAQRDFCQRVIHIGGHYDLVNKLRPDSLEKMAMVLAMIRPAKRHLVDKTWGDIEREIWVTPSDGGYAFKKSHGVAYSHLVAIHMNILDLSD